jgi:hypothetical protein
MGTVIGKGRPSPATLVSVIALVFALTGVAAALPGKNTVEKNDIKKNAVTKKAIKKNAVRTEEIQNGAVTRAKLAAGAVPRAYALVDGDQNIVSGESEGMGGTTTNLDQSFVCFYDMPFTPKNVQVTVVRQSGSLQPDAVNTSTQGSGDISFCDGTEDASVQLFDTSSEVAEADPPGFFVTFYD